VFAAVSVVKGPDTLTDLPTTDAKRAAWLVLLALAVLLIAVLLAVIAEQGAPPGRTVSFVFDEGLGADGGERRGRSRVL
jgi:hypothetical protein